MAKFADYGFNKSHAAAYALVAYQTAWMKANHAEVFIAACMSLALGNTDRLAALREEASRSGIRILPPDINRSGADFSVERRDDGKLAIRYALAAVKKVGFAAMQALAEARGDQPFADLADFAARVDPRQLNRMQLENLIRAGAFDALERQSCPAVRRRRGDPAPRAGNSEGKGKRPDRPVRRHRRRPETLRLPDMPDWPPMERLNFEAEAIGFHLTAHPLDVYAKALRRLGTTACAQVELSAQAGVTRVRLAGTVAAQKERVTRTGNRMAWVRITDASGSCEVTLFAEVLSRVARPAGERPNVLVTADLRQDGEALRVTAQDVAGLDQAAPTPVRRCASGCAKPPRCRTSATCWDAREAARGG